MGWNTTGLSGAWNFIELIHTGYFKQVKVISNRSLIHVKYFYFSPTPEVFWNKYDGILRPDIEKSQGGQEITIPSLRESDGGKYECYGTNSQGMKANRIIVLRVEGSKVFVVFQFYSL